MTSGARQDVPSAYLRRLEEGGARLSVLIGFVLDRPQDLEYLLRTRGRELAQDRDALVSQYAHSYRQSLTNPQHRYLLQLLEQYAPLQPEEYVKVATSLIRTTKDFSDLPVFDLLPARAVLRAAILENANNIIGLTLARMTEATLDDVRMAFQGGDLPVMAALLRRLPKGPPTANETSLVNAVRDRLLRERLPGDADVLNAYLRRGGLLSTGQMATAVPRITAVLDPGHLGDRALLRTMYERGYAGSMLPTTQVDALIGPGLWSVVAHPEQWPLTAYELVQKAQVAQKKLRAGLGRALTPDLARYVLRAL